jgi:hypothetical protein
MDEAEVMTNAEFDYQFAGKTYKVKRVSLKQVMEFQRKVLEINKEKDGTEESRMASYAIYVILHKIDSSITEEYVTENAPGDADIMDIIVRFGFMSQRKMEAMGKISNLLETKKPTGEGSLAS